MFFLIMPDNKCAKRAYVLACAYVCNGSYARMCLFTRLHGRFPTFFIYNNRMRRMFFLHSCFYLFLSLTKLRICRIIQTFVTLNQIKCKI